MKQFSFKSVTVNYQIMVTNFCDFICIFFFFSSLKILNTPLYFPYFHLKPTVIKVWFPDHCITWVLVREANDCGSTPAGTKLKALESRGPAMCLLFIYLIIWVFCLHVFLSITRKPGAYGGQKSVSDLIGLELQMVLSWKWKSGPLKELLMLITNPALQHHVSTCL